MSNKLKFFSGHLLVSVMIGCIFLALVFNVWYPKPLAEATGVTYIIFMLIGIDVILGPVLGFIVYKEKKKSLKFDLSVIILMQFLALGYGIHSVYQGKPAWIVFDVDRFDLIRNIDVVITDKSKVDQQYLELNLFQPKYASTKRAANIKDHTEEMFEELSSGLSLSQLPQFYMPLDKSRSQIIKVAQPLFNLKNYNDEIKVEITLKKYQNADAFLPLKANNKDMTVLLNTKSESLVVGIVNLTPWK